MLIILTFNLQVGLSWPSLRKRDEHWKTRSVTSPRFVCTKPAVTSSMWCSCNLSFVLNLQVWICHTGKAFMAQNYPLQVCFPFCKYKTIHVIHVFCFAAMSFSAKCRRTLTMVGFGVNKRRTMISFWPGYMRRVETQLYRFVVYPKECHILNSKHFSTQIQIWRSKWPVTTLLYIEHPIFSKLHE